MKRGQKTSAEQVLLKLRLIAVQTAQGKGSALACKDRVQRDPSVARGSRSPADIGPRSRLWLNDGSCVRLRPFHRNHVWSFDLVQAQTHDGGATEVEEKKARVDDALNAIRAAIEQGTDGGSA